MVAFGPHPDDIEHTIGGSLIKWASAGKRILLCHLTSGDAGTFGSGELRRSEALAAAKLIGAEAIFLKFEDTNIRDTRAARLALIQVVRKYKPQIILAPYYHFPTMHPDHDATGHIARAIFRLSRFKGIDCGLPPHWPRYLFHYLLPPAIAPSFIIDISDVRERWLDMARCYASQLDNIQNYYNRILSFKQTHLYNHPTADLVEAFYSDRPLDLTDVDLLRLI